MAIRNSLLNCSLVYVSAALACVAISCPAFAKGLGGPLTLADEGAFFVNGRAINSQYPGASLITGPSPPGRMTINQMYVHYRIPSDRRGVPIVMVHGSNHTGMTYETTPDGREGWATWFVRQGHPVYVVDQSGRGRSGFNPTPINAVRDGGADPKAMPTLMLGSLERAWPNFRFGPVYPTPYPNVQFPLEALDQYLMQLVPNTETTLEGNVAQSAEALAALLDKIGAAVIMVHSQSGVVGLDAVRKRPALVRALVSVEGGCETMKPEDAKLFAGASGADNAPARAKVPFVSVWGDNSVGAKDTINGDNRRNGCAAAAKLVADAGGRGSLVLLPETGIKGNSHMMMMDKNNLVVAAALRRWIVKNAGK